MKILVVNTSEQAGGAAIAAGRIMRAMMQMGHECKMLVRDKRTDNPHVLSLPVHPWLLKWRFLWERLVIFARNGFTRKGLFYVDIANAGTDITSLPEFREADVIHLHWVNQGFLSLSDIERILQSSKRIVWTMHDQWEATAICHHSDECEKFQTHCHHCPLLTNGGGEHDLSYSVFEKKQKVFAKARISFVTCSRWLEGRAQKSALLKGQHICSIPNPMDETLFHPMDKSEARGAFNLPADMKLILFASFKVTDKRKGIDYLIQACKILAQQKPEECRQLGIVVVGQESQELFDQFDFPVFPVGYIHDTERMAMVYNAVDAFVTPSLQENLPNTIMEAMACATPCVGFNVGGIPEMIDHKKNGYVAEFRNAEDFATGICYVLNETNHSALAASCLEKVRQCYNPMKVAEQYLKIYEQKP